MNVRPSGLQIAEHCSLAGWLAREYPHTSEAAERGNDVDREVSAELKSGVYTSEDPDVRACVEWVKQNLDMQQGLAIHERIELIDPDTGELLTAGTPDVVGRDFDGLVVVDFKKREQWFAARLAPPDENLQLHAYALAHALSSGVPGYQLCLLLFGDGEVEAKFSRTYTAADWRPYLERIRRISARALDDGGNDSVRPKGYSGPHCTGCYQRSHCPHWMLPPIEAHGAGVLTAVTQPGGITTANASRALVLYMQLAEAHERLGEMLRAFVAAEGPIAVGEEKQWGPITCQGRKSADVSALEKAGLHQFVKRGQPYQSFRMSRR